MTRRGRSNPVAVLTGVALAPALALAAVAVWAGNHEPPPAPGSNVAFVPGVRPATKVMSVRRAPATVSLLTNLRDYADALGSVAEATDATSCFQVSFDGIDVIADNPTLPVIPASNLKLFVAAAALRVLGPDYTFTTEVRGDVDPFGTVTGDLFLVGGGDPLLAAPWYPDSELAKYPQQPATSLEKLADAIVAAGVQEVAGRVVGDGSRFDDEFFPPSWADDVRVTSAGPISALMVNDGYVEGQTAKAADPRQAAAQELARLLAARGVTVKGGVGVEVAPVGLGVVASVDSTTLDQIVGEMLTTSDNNTAELLVKEMGVTASADGTREAGLKALTESLVTAGIPMGGVNLADGSGLSRDNRVTCAAMLAVLQQHSPTDAIGVGLAVAGQTGTLENLFNDDPMEGRLLGKTGTLRDVKALAGYLTSPGGEGDPDVVQFVLIMNSAGIDLQGAYRPIWEGTLSDALSTYPSGPTAAQFEPLPTVGGP